jgi:hypothetical protein
VKGEKNSEVQFSNFKPRKFDDLEMVVGPEGIKGGDIVLSRHGFCKGDIHWVCIRPLQSALLLIFVFSR